jgi:hypothetical protein
MVGAMRTKRQLAEAARSDADRAIMQKLIKAPAAISPAE